MYGKQLENIETFENIISKYERSCGELKKIQQEVVKTEKLKSELFEKYGHKFVNIQNATVGKYSQAEIETIRGELLDTSLWTILKRFFGIEKKQETIYAELMGKIKGLILYLRDEEKKYAEEVQQNFKELEMYAKYLYCEYKKIAQNAGCELSTDWETYQQSELSDKVLYLGNVDVFLETKKMNSDTIIPDILGQYYRNEFVSVPYTRDCSVPFLFYCEYSGENALRKANGFIRSVLYQQIRQMGDYELEMHLMDGENTGNDFSELLGLKQIRENEIWELNTKVTQNIYKYAQTYLSNQDISQGLKDLDQYIGNVAEETAGFPNVKEYNMSEMAKEKGKIPLQLLVVQNFPIGFSTADIELLAKLVKNGEQRGVSVFIQYDKKYRTLFKEKVADPTKNILDGIVLEEQQERIIAKDCSSVIHLQVMNEGRVEYIQSLINEKTKVKEVDNRFASLMNVDGEFGIKDSTRGIFVPFAVDRKGKIKEFMLAQALNAHGLISGTTGSGKTTLLHMIISSVCMNYTTQDIELWLVDYKITEFSSYKYNTPPHIAFLGLSKSVDFTYALIDKIYIEYERRQQTIKAADEEKKLQGEKVNITSFTDYRACYGKNSMKRLLIIIDEFHVMAQQVNEDSDYRQKLENILAEGRAMGITLLFSDQAVTVGLKGLTDKGRKQIKCRLALANDIDEMKEMLQVKSNEDVKPFMSMKTGDCALITWENVRTETGELAERQKIEKVRNIYIDGKTRYDLCKNIRIFYNEDNYLPVYMDETETKKYNDHMIDQWSKKNLKRMDDSRQVYIYYGEPLDLTGCLAVPLFRRRTENIMSVGGMEEEQIRLILSQIRSFQRVNNHKILIFSDPYCSLFTMYEDKFLAMQDDDPSIEIYSEPADVCRKINDLVFEIGDKTKEKRMLVIWIGLDDMYEEFQTYSDEKPESYKKANKKAGSVDLSEALSEKWDALFGTDLLGENSLSDNSFDFGKDENYYDEEEEECEGVYNAIEDIVQIFHMGPRQGIFNSVVYDNTYPIRNNRKIKVDDFKHKLAFPMGRDECGEFLGRTMLLDGMENQKGVVAYYDGKGRVKKFVPYSFDNN